ncbi:uncharacterized protein LOC116964067 isoform X1 [Tyto alba]|uniref:uncharacterized protein LOC116964067 isoform X1 n=1 Tax=Tyto alba TaxID=56313 RepID=UPI001C6657C9|nr:uncharacterized protein LOC116964067 isoform X1 [Tyto alba]
MGTRPWAQGMSLSVPSPGTSPHGGTLAWGCCVSTRLGVGCRVNSAACTCACVRFGGDWDRKESPGQGITALPPRGTCSGCGRGDPASPGVTVSGSLLAHCKTHSIFPHGDRETDQTSPLFVTASSSSSLASPRTPPTKHPYLISSVSVPTQTTPEGKAVQPTSNIFHHKGSSPPPLDVVEHILTPGIVVVLLLLAVAAGILVILSRKRKKALSGAAVEMDRTHGASHMEADALNYAEINHPMHTAESQLYSNTQAFHCLANTTSEYMEVKQSDKCLEEKKEATCTTVQHSPPEQQEIYANVPSAAARRV